MTRTPGETRGDESRASCPMSCHGTVRAHIEAPRTARYPPPGTASFRGRTPLLFVVTPQPSARRRGVGGS